MMRLELPFPPSTNTAYATVRGRRVKTKRAREYADEAHICAFVNPATQRLRFDMAQLAKAGSEHPRLAVRLDAEDEAQMQALIDAARRNA